MSEMRKYETSEHKFIDGRWEIGGAYADDRLAKQPDPEYPATLIPAERYYDKAEMEREWDQLWTKVWTMAGRESDVPNPGDYFVYDLGRESIIVVRGNDNKLRAMYNVCAHRGNQIVYNKSGTVREFTCAFHSWTYALDGSLVRITNEEMFPDALICDRPGLPRIQCDVWGGFVFVNMDPHAEPLMDFLGDLPRQLAAYQLERFRIFKDVEMRWNANWKTAIEAFIEVYHAHVVHPETLTMLDEVRVQYDCLSNGHSRMCEGIGMVSPIEPAVDELTPALRMMLQQFGVDPDTYNGPADNIRDTLVLAKRAWAEANGVDLSALDDGQLKDLWNFHIFPNVTLNLTGDACLVQRWRPDPDDPEKLTYDVLSLLPPVDNPDTLFLDLSATANETGMVRFDPKVRPPRLYTQDGNDLGYVLNQDYQQVPRQQKALRSRGFAGMRFGREEIRIRHYLAEIDRYLGRQGAAGQG